MEMDLSLCCSQQIKDENKEWMRKKKKNEFGGPLFRWASNKQIFVNFRLPLLFLNFKETTEFASVSPL